MATWCDSLLKPLVPGISRKTIIVDPDEIFRDDRLFRDITDRGFAVVYFEDSISLRFAYESDFRQAWDHGENRELIIVVRPDSRDSEQIPADIVENARKLAFYLRDVFPNLSYKIVSQLDRSYFDVLFGAHSIYAHQPLGEALTKEFILKHVFETVPELIRKDSDLLRVLLQRHYRRQNVPPSLDEYLVSVLDSSGRFLDWPLNTILSDRDAFWEFLQERWPLFVEREIGAPPRRDHGDFKYRGAYNLPFDHDDIRGYIESCFTEGLLHPINLAQPSGNAARWVRAGIKGDAVRTVDVRFEDICKAVQENTPGADANVYTWLAFAYRYGHMQRVWNEDSHMLNSPWCK